MGDSEICGVRIVVAIIPIIGRDKNDDGLSAGAVARFSDAHFHLGSSVCDVLLFAVTNIFVGVKVDHIIVVFIVVRMFIFVLVGVGAGEMVIIRVVVGAIDERHIFIKFNGDVKAFRVIGASDALGAVPDARNVVFGCNGRFVVWLVPVGFMLFARAIPTARLSGFGRLHDK